MLLGRILFGGYFLWNAYTHFTKTDALAGYAASKGIKSGRLAVIGTGLLLFVGGAGILFNMQLSIAYACLVVFLVPAAFMMHNFWKETDPNQRMMATILFARNIALTGAILMLWDAV